MFRKLKLLREYIKTLKTYTQDIKQHFIDNKNNFSYDIIDMNYDNVYRFYTVLNLKPNTTENIQKYGYRYMDNETKKFLAELDSQFKKYGLFELYGMTKADQISETSIHIVVEFKFLKTTKLAKNLLILSSLLILGLASLLFLL